MFCDTTSARLTVSCSNAAPELDPVRAMLNRQPRQHQAVRAIALKSGVPGTL